MSATFGDPGRCEGCGAPVDPDVRVGVCGACPMPVPPATVVERLTWLLADGSVSDDQPMTAAMLRNVLAGRELGDAAGDACA